MLPEDHIQGIGKLVTNFQVLGIWLRLYLLKVTDQEGSDEVLDFSAGPLWSTVPVTRFTDYASLHGLGKEFNEHMHWQKKTGLDQTLVGLRDAHAHGRVFATNAGFPFRLIKFANHRDAVERRTHTQHVHDAGLVQQEDRWNPCDHKHRHSGDQIARDLFQTRL